MGSSPYTLIVWLPMIQRQVSDGCWYGKIPEVQGDCQAVQCDVTYHLHTPYHVSHSRTGMRTMVLGGQRHEP